MYKLPTISSLQRAMECPGSVVLPQLPDTEQSASALRGSRIHAWIAAQLTGAPSPDIGKTKVSHIDMDGLRRFLGDGEIRCEAAFSYSYERYSQYLGDNLGRDYPDIAAINGAADILVVRPHILVVDIKTGSYPVPRPQDNWQLAALAALALDTFDAEAVTGAIATLSRDGGWVFESYTWSTGEARIVLDRLLRSGETWSAAAELESSGWGAPVVVGRECAFCKARCQHNPRVQREAI